MEFFTMIMRSVGIKSRSEAPHCLLVFTPSLSNDTVVHFLEVSLAAARVAAIEESAALLKRLGAVLAMDFAGAAADVSTAGAVATTRSAEEALGDLKRLLAAEAPYPAGLGADLARVVQELLALREAARKNKAWAEADRIRQTLGAQGIRVDDTRTACHAVSEFPAERGLPTINVSLVKG